MKINIVPAHGERAFICGQTGSGKTAFAVWLLGYMPGTLIYDTKEEGKFAALANSITVETMPEAYRALRENRYDYVILRPPVSVTIEPEQLDDMLHFHYNNLRGCGAYLDEVFMFHNAGRVGPGLMAMLTRGRSRGITLTMSAQRPAWLSRFCLTESQKFFIFRLVDRADRLRLGEIIPGIARDFNPAPYHFQYFDFSLNGPVNFLPVPLDKSKISAEYDGSQESNLTWI